MIHYGISSYEPTSRFLPTLANTTNSYTSRPSTVWVNITPVVQLITGLKQGYVLPQKPTFNSDFQWNFAPNHWAPPHWTLMIDDGMSSVCYLNCVYTSKPFLLQVKMKKVVSTHVVHYHLISAHKCQYVTWIAVILNTGLVVSAHKPDLCCHQISHRFTTSFESGTRRTLHPNNIADKRTTAENHTVRWPHKGIQWNHTLAHTQNCAQREVIL